MDGISKHYGVSYTPVRQALGGLIRGGLIRKKSNGRLEAMKQIHTKSPLEFVKSKTVVKDPSKAITEELVELSLSGEPRFIREEITAQKHGLTRSSLRHILQRLAGEGLLLHIPRRGWQVKPFRQEDLQAFIEVREVMELKALDLASEKLRIEESKKRLKKIREGNRLSSGGKVTIDNSLHQFLLSLADNPYLNDFFERHGKYFSILFDWEGNDQKAGKEAISQHHQIIDALLEENWELAKKRLSLHLQTNHPVLGNMNDLQPKG